MQLDDDVEETLRYCYAAIVDREPETLVLALQDVRDGDTMGIASTGEKILLAALWTAYDSRLPTPEEVRSLAEKTHAEESSWVGSLPSVDEFDSLLRQISKHPATAVVAPGEAILVLVFAAAHLLRRAPDGLPWNEYLDALEDMLEGTG